MMYTRNRCKLLWRIVTFNRVAFGMYLPTRERKSEADVDAKTLVLYRAKYAGWPDSMLISSIDPFRPAESGRKRNVSPFASLNVTLHRVNFTRKILLPRNTILTG